MAIFGKKSKKYLNKGLTGLRDLAFGKELTEADIEKLEAKAKLRRREAKARASLSSSRKKIKSSKPDFFGGFELAPPKKRRKKSSSIYDEFGFGRF